MLLPELLEVAQAAGDRQHVWRFPKDKVELPLGDIVAASDRYASALASLGVRAGDRVGLVLENGPEYPSVILGIWQLGAIAVPLRPSGGLRFALAGFLHDIDADCSFRLLVFEDDVDEAVLGAWLDAPGHSAIRKTRLRELSGDAPPVSPVPLEPTSVVPFAAVTQFHDPAVEFALTFHADAAEAPPEEHEEAENDTPEVATDEAARDDGSNVVNVDFTRKK